MIVDHHAGEMPREPAAVRALPGVGRYISGAILSFAFDLPAPIVEANSQRVFARLLAWRSDLKTAASQNRLWVAAGRLVPSKSAGKFNQALMDLAPCFAPRVRLPAPSVRSPCSARLASSGFRIRCRL